MSWKDIGSSEGSGNFLRLKDGEKAKIHVISEEPFSFLSCFFQAINRNAVCRMEEKNKYPKDLKWRVQHAFVVYNLDTQSPAIWIVGNQVADQVKNVYDNYEGLESVDLIVRREGSKLNTRYTVVPKPTSYEKPDDIDWPDLEESIPSTPLEKVEEMAQGIDPDADFNPEKLEQEAQTVNKKKLQKPVVEDTDDEPTENEAAQDVQNPIPKRGRGRPPKQTPVQTEIPGSQAPTNGDGNERPKLLAAIVAGWQDQKFKTDPQLRMKVMQVAAGGKASLSQCSIEELRQIVISQDEA